MSYSIRPIQFSGYKDLREKQAHEQILFGRDASEQAKNDIFNKIARERALDKGSDTLVKGAGGAIATDIFTAGASKTGELGTKLGAGALRTGAWAGSIGTVLGYTAAVNQVMDSYDSIKEASSKHPIATALLYMAGGIASLTGMDKLYRVAQKAVTNRFPKEVASMTKKVDSIKTAIDKSWVNNELAKPIKEIAAKAAKGMPTVTEAVKAAAPYAPYAILGAAAIKTVADLNKDFKEEKAKLEEDYESALQKVALKTALAKIQELDNAAKELYFVFQGASNPEILGGKAASVRSNNFSRFDDDDKEDNSYAFEENSDINLGV